VDSKRDRLLLSWIGEGEEAWNVYIRKGEYDVRSCQGQAWISGVRKSIPPEGDIATNSLPIDSGAPSP
jgi:hypothetical protein